MWNYDKVINEKNGYFSKLAKIGHCKTAWYVKMLYVTTQRLKIYENVKEENMDSGSLNMHGASVHLSQWEKKDWYFVPWDRLALRA